MASRQTGDTRAAKKAARKLAREQCAAERVRLKHWIPQERARVKGVIAQLRAELKVQIAQV
jgi:hypothetical protein